MFTRKLFLALITHSGLINVSSAECTYGDCACVKVETDSDQEETHTNMTIQISAEGSHNWHGIAPADDRGWVRGESKERCIDATKVIVETPGGNDWLGKISVSFNNASYRPLHCDDCSPISSNSTANIYIGQSLPSGSSNASNTCDPDTTKCEFVSAKCPEAAFEYWMQMTRDSFQFTDFDVSQCWEKTNSTEMVTVTRASEWHFNIVQNGHIDLSGADAGIKRILPRSGPSGSLYMRIGFSSTVNKTLVIFLGHPNNAIDYNVTYLDTFQPLELFDITEQWYGFDIPQQWYTLLQSHNESDRTLYVAIDGVLSHLYMLWWPPDPPDPPSMPPSMPPSIPSPPCMPPSMPPSIPSPPCMPPSMPPSSPAPPCMPPSMPPSPPPSMPPSMPPSIPSPPCMTPSMSPKDPPSPSPSPPPSMLTGEHYHAHLHVHTYSNENPSSTMLILTITLGVAMAILVAAGAYCYVRYYRKRGSTFKSVTQVEPETRNLPVLSNLKT